MKSLKKIGITLLTLTVLIMNASCSSDSSSGPSSSSPLSFKVNGTATTAGTVQATLYTNVVAGGRYIDVYGFQGENQIVEFHFPAKTGSFAAQQSFDMSTSWLTYITNNGTDAVGDYFHSTSGTINVTTCDTINNKIVATFNFVGNNTTADKTITEGSLNINAITHQ
ncbi:hypothetical protein EZL74_12165 [Flavobacterium silvisoli]|uniref:Lipoprotein n=1 Tax=Flavobacterium silvisoli TaxID=2529433 RepID=A0A4Q9YVP3_9FLAO|nr:hypothetical protein [Flavobacterium silvisoli]TBX65365.1 hypothetical protein EZL74_12165 [Flavobacterium silvisoli]